MYSPGIVIFRDDLEHNCSELPQDEWRVVSVITVAAPRKPVLINGEELEDSVLEEFKEKVRLVYRMAASNGNEYLVLGELRFEYLGT